MTRYVDGYVLPVKKDRLEEYRGLAGLACEVWREHGALEYVEAVADDVKPGKLTSFPQSVLLEPNETVVFAWIVYASREDRDRVNKKVMEDPRMKGMDMSTMPIDGKRMIWGGFRTIVEG